MLKASLPTRSVKCYLYNVERTTSNHITKVWYLQNICKKHCFLTHHQNVTSVILKAPIPTTSPCLTSVILEAPVPNIFPKCPFYHAKSTVSLLITKMLPLSYWKHQFPPHHHVWHLSFWKHQFPTYFQSVPSIMLKALFPYSSPKCYLCHTESTNSHHITKFSPLSCRKHYFYHQSLAAMYLFITSSQ